MQLLPLNSSFADRKMKFIIAITIIMHTVIGYAEPMEHIKSAILPTSEWQYLPYSIDGKPSKGWMISEDIVDNAQPIILEYIKIKDKEIYNNINRYRCQYFGIIIKGKKRIYCNFIWHQNYNVDWRTNPIIVKDGGKHYFQIEYDVDSNTCIKFSINGEA